MKTIILHRRKLIILVLIGIIIAFVLHQSMGLTGWRFASDLFFTLSMVFFISALGQLVSNLGMFNSFIYGFKCFFQIFKNKKSRAGEMRDGYLEYVQSRPQKTGTWVLALFAAVFTALSVLASLVA